MLSLGELKIGTVFVMDDDPWQVLEAHFVKKAQRTGHLETKIRNLKNGSVLTRSFKQADRFAEADIEKVKAMFIYRHRGKYVFAFTENPRERFELSEDLLDEDRWYLTPNLAVEALRFGNAFIGINVPPKVDVKVTEAAPWMKGDTATGGSKIVVTETGLKIRTPHFIETGNIIRVNTKTGEYAERVGK